MQAKTGADIHYVAANMLAYNMLRAHPATLKSTLLVEMLAKREIPLIEDDIYGDLGFGPARPLPAKAFDRKGLVMLCDSFSKTLAPGYRVGWTAPGRFQKQVEHLKFLNTIATATLPQYAIADFLANGGYDHHLRKVRRVYAEKVRSMTLAKLWITFCCDSRLMC